MARDHNLSKIDTAISAATAEEQSKCNSPVNQQGKKWPIINLNLDNPLFSIPSTFSPIFGLDKGSPTSPYFSTSNYGYHQQQQYRYSQMEKQLSPLDETAMLVCPDFFNTMVDNNPIFINGLRRNLLLSIPPNSQNIKKVLYELCLVTIDDNTFLSKECKKAYIHSQNKNDFEFPVYCIISEESGGIANLVSRPFHNSGNNGEAYEGSMNPICTLRLETDSNPQNWIKFIDWIENLFSQCPIYEVDRECEMQPDEALGKISGFMCVINHFRTHLTCLDQNNRGYCQQHQYKASQASATAGDCIYGNGGGELNVKVGYTSVDVYPNPIGKPPSEVEVSNKITENHRVEYRFFTGSASSPNSTWHHDIVDILNQQILGFDMKLNEAYSHISEYLGRSNKSVIKDYDDNDDNDNDDEDMDFGFSEGSEELKVDSGNASNLVDGDDDVMYY
ncbi:hypothetical protein H4219_006365 [Mycoemilia scoparia]|uniref:Uncharacterized protein n=1 Tax=Mycoemilia scoparia TaxID=417184 RepID=A0A9W7ZI47_9FUNG|nr:hypothetical protein H4219_006365 [Mycoemilia scoparia]